MTGRELIIYILENGLEDAEMFTDKRPGTIFITPEIAAFRWGCGSATVKAMLDMGKIEGIKIGDYYLILSKQPNPFDKRKD